jgi:hypothetical protein
LNSGWRGGWNGQCWCGQYGSDDLSHLPKFNLPDFNGNILMWNAFFYVFEVEVHQKKITQTLPNSTFWILVSPAKLKLFYSAWYREMTTTL